MATTFNPNRVGPGTFELVRDPSTGTYSLKEVGFTKLPSLTLPDLSPTTTTTTQTKTQDQTKTDTTDATKPILPQVGGGGDNQQVSTNITTLKNPDSQIDQATQISQGLQTFSPDTAEEQFRRQATLPTTTGAFSPDTAPQQFRRQATLPEVNENLIDRGNPTGDSRIVSEEQGLVGGRVPDAIRTGQPAIGMGVPDAIRFGQPALPDQNLIDKAKDLVSNSLSFKAVAKGAEIAGTVLKGAATAIFGPETNSQTHAKGYFNVAGTSTQPQRIAGNPAENVFAGANRNARDLDKVAQKRIDTIEKNLAANKYRDPDKKREQLKNFKEQQDNYRRDRNDTNIKNYSKKKDATPISQLNPNEMRNVAESGDPGGDKGGKIVCTMMNESYGFGSFRNKIWMKFHGNIAPEYQKGYHKLFLPLVNYAKQKGITNKIIKNILEHIAVHSTIDMRQTLRGKRHTLGRLYRKVILPLCYWAGKK
mgnify:CR=1 FL=1